MIIKSKKSFVDKTNHKYIIIVSGLPRSGTSMMMQILNAGGIEIVTDNIRKPDEDNIQGYFEYEPVKKLKEDNSWINNCYGKAIKIISMLLYDLPDDHNYKIIFMNRDIKEILASQKLMLQRRGNEDESAHDNQISANFKNHLKQVISWLDKQKNINYVSVNYNSIIKDPNESISIVNRFLGNNLNSQMMTAVVNQKFYRQRNHTYS